MKATKQKPRTTTKIINKLAAVDRDYAISSESLAEALKRTKSAAKDAGVGVNELIGMVTAIKEITGREVSVVGNSLKTILTRLSRQSVVYKLFDLGIVVTDENWARLRPFDLLISIAKSFKKLSKPNQQQVLELGAGVFMLTEFKVLLSTLDKTY